MYDPEFGNACANNIGLDNLPFCLIFTARTKYLKDKSKYNLKSNEQFYKSIIRSKDKFLKKLNERNLDTVFDRDGNKLPKECFAAYVTLNPRDPRKALFRLQKYLIDIAEREDIETAKRLDILAFKSYHTSPLKVDRAVIDFDVNDKNDETIDTMLKSLEPIKDTIHAIIETHGGFHAYINLNKTTKEERKYLFQDLKRNFNSSLFKEVIVNTDPMVVIPGTLQGGFEVKFRDDLITKLFKGGLL